jgi:peptidoglycan/LPS O-acetylase OafA/YrhL
MRRVTSLDGIRGIAILMVLSFHWIFASLPGWHSPELTESEDIVRHIFMLNWTGVDLFFVLSGFLIGGIIVDNRSATNFFGVFYARRAFRILPLYALILLSFVILSAIVPRQHSEPLQRVFGNPAPLWVYLLFLQNLNEFVPQYHYGNMWLGNTWSLAVEEQFYFMLPIAIFLTPRRLLPIALCLGIITAIVLRVIMFFFVPNGVEILYEFIFCRMDALLIGVLCAWIVRAAQWSLLVEQHIREIKLTAAFMALVLIGFIMKRWSGNDMPMATLGMTWVAGMYGCCILIAYYDPPKLLENPVLRQFGVWAYCLYLVHRPVGQLVHWMILGKDQAMDTISGVLATLVSLGCIILIAHLSWRHFERPLLRLGHKWRYSFEPTLETSLLIQESPPGRG